MSSPSNHGILTGAYFQYIRRKMNLLTGNIMLTDNWYEVFKPLNISRPDMMILFPFCMKSDILTGLELLEPYEYPANKNNKS